MSKRPVPKYDFKAFGAAIKAARTGRKESRKKVSDESLTHPSRKAGFENGCLSRNLNYEMLILDDGETFEKFDDFLATHIKQGRLSFDGIFCVTDKVAYYTVE